VVANEYVELSDVGTPELTNKIVSTVQSNPSIDYIDISVGDLSIGVAAALKGAGLDDIKIIVHVPTDADFESLRKGDVDMLVHRSTVLATWMQIDGVARVLDSGKPVNGLPYPTTILTQDTVPESGGVEEIVFPEDYEDEFIGLWRTN
jgi:ABC-type sugar transport system substrate-binding protein